MSIHYKHKTKAIFNKHIKPQDIKNLEYEN